jgi:radical SAM protein with 4Fe4S-binding SPASM domain
VNTNPVPVVPTPLQLRHMRIAVSYYCNLRCQHCYVPEVNRVEYRKTLEPSELTVDKILSFVDRLIAECGLEKVSITGGEALLNVVWPRTAAVLRHALDRGLEVQLNTSGSGQVGMNKIADLCGEDLKLLTIQLSLDGVDADAVDRFRGRKGAMSRAVTFLEEAVSRNVAVQARMTMTESNADQVVPCYDFVSARGAESFHVKPMFAAGTGRENQDLLVWSREQVRDIQLQLLSRSVGRATRLGLPEPVYVPESDFPQGANAHTIKCTCGDATGYISTNGDVYPCTYLVGAPNDESWILGNIGDPNFDFVSAWTKPTTYSNFRYVSKEGQCPAQNALSEGLGLDLGPIMSECD